MAKKKVHPTERQIKEWKEKAAKWDALHEKIWFCYFDKDGNELEGNETGLDAIGEHAAMAFGFL
jgi:hypothetical protein